MNNSITINPTVERLSNLEHCPRELLPDASATETESVIHAIYRQLLGNAYVMESERLSVPESQLKAGELSVREFVRHLAKSELYKSRFIDNCPRYRTHELNFKHILGRAPDGYDETFIHSQILDSYGYEADIDSYIDSDEYQEVFGENIIPYYRGDKTLTGKKLLGYINTLQILQSSSTSDRAASIDNSPQLVKSLIYNNPKGTVPVTDVKKLLEDVFNNPVRSQLSKTQFVAYTGIQKSKSEPLEAEITKLQAELAQLQSLASIGSAGINRWQSSYIDITHQVPPSYSHSKAGMQNNLDSIKKEQIAALKQEIAQAKSFAALGEARLNKWRK